MKPTFDFPVRVIEERWPRTPLEAGTRLAHAYEYLEQHGRLESCRPGWRFSRRRGAGEILLDAYVDAMDEMMPRAEPLFYLGSLRCRVGWHAWEKRVRSRYVGAHRICRRCLRIEYWPYDTGRDRWR